MVPDIPPTCDPGHMLPCYIYLAVQLITIIGGGSLIVYMIWQDRQSIHEGIKEHGFWKYLWNGVKTTTLDLWYND